MARFKGNAAITWSSTGDTNTERVHLLDVPLRELKAAHTLTEFSRESLDKSTIETFTVGSGAYELVGSVRFDHDPSSLIDLVVAGSQGRTLTYWPDLTDPGVSYGCLLVSPRSPFDLGLDSQRPGDHAIELRLRRTNETAFHPLGIQTNLLFWYRAGDSLAAATFSRTGTNARYTTNGQGTLTAAGASIARIDWFDDDGDYLREVPTLLIEGAETNLITDSENFGAWTSDGTPVVTGGAQTDPEGATDAYDLEDNDAGAVEGIYLPITFTGDATKALSVFMRRGTAADATVELFDSTAGTIRHGVNVDWTTYIPVLSSNTGSGTLFPVERWSNDWWRVHFSVASVTAANTNRMRIYPTDKTAASVGITSIFGAMAVDQTYCGSYIPTAAGTAARGTDNLQWPISQSCQPITIYLRFVERGSILGIPGSSTRLCVIGSSSEAVPSLVIHDNASSRYTITHDTGSSTASTTTVASSLGDVVEVVGQLYANGSVQIHQALNDGAFASGTQSAANANTLRQQWSDDIFWLGQRNGSAAGKAGFLNAVVVRDVHGPDAMRRVARNRA